MTKEEAVELLKGRKVYVNGKSKEIQEKLFELGFLWDDGDDKVCCVYKPFLYISTYMRITYSDDMKYFKCNQLKEISADEILSIKLEHEFKDGDIVVSGCSFGGESYSWVAIIGLYTPNNYVHHALLCLRGDEDCCTHVKYNESATSQEYTRLATDEEKKVLFDALKKDGKRWDAEKKSIENIEHEFKPFEKVLVRDEDNKVWRANLFSQKTTDKEYPFICMSCPYRYCIPYDGNENLLGTNNPCKNER
ncbi:MAG: hypothetical protein RR220_07945 [Bacteroidaceae bacterium]